MSETVTVGNVSAEHFEALIGAGFQVEYPDHAETLTLTRVSRGGMNPPKSQRTQAFSAFFRGESTTVMLKQFTHTLTNDTLGSLDIFLVPVERNEDGTHLYQAVFN